MVVLMGSRAAVQGDGPVATAHDHCAWTLSPSSATSVREQMRSVLRSKLHDNRRKHAKYGIKDIEEVDAALAVEIRQWAQTHGYYI